MMITRRPVQQAQGDMNSFAIFGADGSDWAPWLRGSTKRKSRDGLPRRIHRSPRTTTPVLNHSELFKKLFSVFVSSGEFPAGDGGDLTAERGRFRAGGRFSSLHVHTSVSWSDGFTSPQHFVKGTFFFFPRHNQVAWFWSASTLMWYLAPLASRQRTHTGVWIAYISSSCWQTHFSSFVALSGVCTRNSFRCATRVCAYFKFSPTLETEAAVWK